MHTGLPGPIPHGALCRVSAYVPRPHQEAPFNALSPHCPQCSIPGFSGGACWALLLDVFSFCCIYLPLPMSPLRWALRQPDWTIRKEADVSLSSALSLPGPLP